jgi:DNA (cytosine-5)-methyltransferase 1
MKHASLFSGIGGFELAAQWMGWENVFHCEINPFGQQVLKHYWPNSISYHDIKETDFTIWRGRVDILTGGFPCQPYSAAGKRLGTEDDRHLWPEMCRAIREIQPQWVVGENVRGLTNWNGGLVFDEVQADLEAAGYSVQSFLLPAAGVGAPHERYRIWFVAYSESSRDRRGLHGMERSNESIGQPKEHRENNLQYWDNGTKRIITDTDSYGGCRSENEINTANQRINAQRRPGIDVCNGVASDTSDKGSQRSENNGIPGSSRKKSYQQFTGRIRSEWEQFPTQSPVCSRNDGLSSRLVGITFPKHRNESIKSYGNSVIPQLVMQIFKAIEQCTP